jgi:hypothetical protein
MSKPEGLSADPTGEHGYLGLGWTAGRVKRRCGGGSKTPPKGYVIVEGGVRSLLPERTWEQANARINELFQDAGKLLASYVKSIQDLPQLNLIDAVVECYLDPPAASDGFRRTVYNKLIALGRDIPELSSLAKRFNRPEYYSVDTGRSFTVKGVFPVPPSKPKLVCFMYAVIAVTQVFSLWSGLIGDGKKITLATLKNAPQAEQVSFGITLGNAIAHELRHQLALSKTGLGLDDSATGLGKAGADIRDPKSKFTDKDVILANLAALRRVQHEHAFRTTSQ